MSWAIVAAMVRRLSCFAFSLALLALLGCGTTITPKDVDEPCTRTDQCKTGLVCLFGVCLPATDAGPDVSVDPDGGS
ncbi:MAG: hypothetical protein OEM15_02380 [Myxococcales bacterium]|nr:hypothetical protein [Myxococcales bacterium]MDH3485794.1 hypothetical protein [Myxococcales bacterium]